MVIGIDAHFEVNKQCMTLNVCWCHGCSAKVIINYGDVVWKHDIIHKLKVKVDKREDDRRWWMNDGIDVLHKLNKIMLMSFIMRMITSVTLKLTTLKMVVNDDDNGSWKEKS